MGNAQGQDRTPSLNFLTESVDVGKLCTVLKRREAVFPNHGVELRLSFLLNFGVKNQGKNESLECDNTLWAMMSHSE
jgi:hypothetical protein